MLSNDFLTHTDFSYTLLAHIGTYHNTLYLKNDYTLVLKTNIYYKCYEKMYYLYLYNLKKKLIVPSKKRFPRPIDLSRLSLSLCMCINFSE